VICIEVSAAEQISRDPLICSERNETGGCREKAGTFLLTVSVPGKFDGRAVTRYT
jgi:hypothetical protein